MRRKNKKNLFLVVIVIYFLVGLSMFSIDKEPDTGGQYLENNEGQEIGLKMSELENKVIKRINSIERQRKENTLDENILLEEIETSIRYLQDNVGKENIASDVAFNLLYHSSFLKSLGEQYEINDNNMIKVSKEIHSYMIDRLYGGFDADREKKLKEEIPKLTEEQSLKILKLIIE